MWHGYIDDVRTVEIHGWAASKEHSQPLNIIVLINDNKVGEGIAGITRGDLKEHGIHEGYHGFTIPIDLDYYGFSESKITIVDGDSLEVIDHNDFKIKKLDFNFSGKLCGVENGHMRARLWADEPIGEKVVAIIIDEAIELKLVIDIEDNFIVS